MNESERSETIGEVVTPAQSGEERDASAAADGEKGIGLADRSGQNEQSHEENHRYQAARRGGERAGYERATREINQRIAAAGVKDASGRAIRTIEELEARERKGPARKTESMKDIWRLAEEAQSFAERYPDVDMNELHQSAAFRKFCGSRLGKESVTDLYSDYLEFTGDARQTAKEKADSKRERNTGSGSGSGGGELSRNQQAELDEWNKAYPNLKMSAREFLSRK